MLTEIIESYLNKKLFRMLTIGKTILLCEIVLLGILYNEVEDEQEVHRTQRQISLQCQ
jgi:hypothetical protein